MTARTDGDQHDRPASSEAQHKRHERSWAHLRCGSPAPSSSSMTRLT
jgi:hypothetical protein